MHTLKTIKSTIIPYLYSCSRALADLADLADFLAPTTRINHVNSVNENERNRKMLGGIKNTSKNKNFPNLRMTEATSSVLTSACPT